MKSKSLFGQPVALIPLAMSLVALLIVGGHVALLGAARELDESSDAHMFQFLITAF